MYFQYETYKYIRKGTGSRNCGGEVSGSAVCKLETQENPRCGSSLSPEAWGWGEPLAKFWAEGRRPVFQLMQSGRESEFSSPFLCLFVPFISSTDCMRPTHIGWRKSALLSLLTQVLMSSGNTLTDTTRNNVKPDIWAPCAVVKLTSKINHHNTLAVA